MVYGERTRDVAHPQRARARRRTESLRSTRSRETARPRLTSIRSIRVAGVVKQSPISPTFVLVSKCLSREARSRTRAHTTRHALDTNLLYNRAPCIPFSSFLHIRTSRILFFFIFILIITTCMRIRLYFFFIRRLFYDRGR